MIPVQKIRQALSPLYFNSFLLYIYIIKKSVRAFIYKTGIYLALWYCEHP